MSQACAHHFYLVSTIDHSLWLATQAVNLLVGWWPVTITLLIAVLMSSRTAEEHGDEQLRSLPSLLFMFPLLILIWGSLAGVDSAHPGFRFWRLAVIALLIALQAAVSVALIYVARGARWPTAWFAALLAWISTVCAYLSGLAVSGHIPLPA